MEKLAEKAISDLHDYLIEVICPLIPNGGCVLDLGAGSGAFVYRFIKLGFNGDSNIFVLEKQKV